MKRNLAALAFPLLLSLSACGGGDDVGAAAAPSKFAIKLTYSGLPLIKAQQSSKMSAVDVGTGRASSQPSSDGQATVDALQKKFSEAGTGVTVYPGVIDGTTLHQIVMSVNDGVGPTEDEMRNAKHPVVLDEWVVLNFELDDMQTGRSDPAQVAALAQFKKDLIVFQNRLSLENKQFYKVLPIRTCELPEGQTAADGLIEVLKSVPNSGYLLGLRDAPDKAHMGADCRTPDAETREAHLNEIVSPVVASYNAVNQQVNDCRTNPASRPEWECWGIEPVKK
ncbi:hypothetical protein GQ57_15850 [Burkholderia sp. MSh2]|uniref:Lipoprotein n=1 Tax=Burkholderia paludis TaxID=1506587 RepID=A0A6J5DBJ9_9BURK|nr:MULTISPECIES: hypothetical protein [Burkholderia]KEZ04796.1 hypothetical protein GQ57_15850 [Burkholderia sp. MSh2]CAB3750767.1 hypothetical protein LMG30113_01289 [Burkholderia paludis]VWB10469.1 hypothetical protein BPA30113_00188 [Burkholderia paludis]